MTALRIHGDRIWPVTAGAVGNPGRKEQARIIVHALEQVEEDEEDF